MSSVGNPYSVILLGSFVIATGTAVVAWRTRPAAGSAMLAAFMASVAGWLGAHVLEIEATSFAWKLVWADLQWVFAALIPTFFLVFALAYTGKDRWFGRRIWLVAIEPLVMLGFLAVNDSTGILWGTPYAETVSLGLSWAPPATVATAEPGIGTFVHLGYATLCLAVVSVLVLDLIVRNEQFYRWQGVTILLAIAVPWAMAVISISSLEIVGTTPIGLTITGLAITFGLYRYRLLDFTPIARTEVVANLDDGVLVVDERYRIVDCNPIAQEYFEDRDSLVGESIESIVPTDVEALLQPNAAAEHDGSAHFSLGDGANVRQYELSTAPITDGRDQSIGWTVVVHDVTERVRRERELERANRQLENFTSVVSHDLRNPLTVSQGYLELLEEEYNPRYVARIADSHDRMEQLIDGMLALARQGQAALEPEPVALEQVASAAWATVDTREATLSVVDDRPIEADKAQLQQLLENLFRNAVEHSSTSRSEPDGSEDAVERGSTTLDSQVRRDAVERDSDSVTVTVGTLEDGLYVGDSGRGFRTDTERIFESGYTTDAHGTGLGLTIVADIVDRHGWTVTATDGEGGGARFEIRNVEFVDSPAETDSSSDDSAADTTR